MEVITRVPQGSILGPLFNIFLNDIFLPISKSQLCKYVDDNTLYKSGKKKNDLETDFIILHKWFHENHMILNRQMSLYFDRLWWTFPQNNFE